MERKRHERIKEAIIEPVPETDSNGSREENGEEAEVRNRLHLNCTRERSMRKEH